MPSSEPLVTTNSERHVPQKYRFPVSLAKVPTSLRRPHYEDYSHGSEERQRAGRLSYWRDGHPAVLSSATGQVPDEYRYYVPMERYFSVSVWSLKALPQRTGPAGHRLSLPGDQGPACLARDMTRWAAA